MGEGITGMPTAPQLDGLPLWLQVILSMAFGIAALAVAFRGYRKGSTDAGASPVDDQGSQVRILAASIADTGAQRHLADTIVHLDGSVVRAIEASTSLERSVTENTHWTRSKWEQDRELCQRLRELKEAMERR
jgi:hypothetical protein